jgi:hypothetical protein
MAKRKSRLDIHVEKTENMVRYLLRKKTDSIQSSMVRPLYLEALKSLYLVCVLLVDTLIPLEVFRILPPPFNSIISLVILGIFLYIEIVMYNCLWGKKGRWSIDNYKKSFEKAVEEKKT